MLVLPMLLSSIQTAKETPALVLGMNTVSPGWKKKLLQTSIVIFSPVTILLMRLQYQMTLKKFEKLQELQNEKFFDEFSRILSLLEEMKNRFCTEIF